MAVLMGKSGSCRRTLVAATARSARYSVAECACVAQGVVGGSSKNAPRTSRERPKNAPVLPGCIRAGINQTVPMIGEGTVDLVKTGSARSRSRAATRTDRAATRRGSFLIA